MIQYQDALELIRSNSIIENTEKVDLTGARQRILAEDVHYDSNIPPFNKSAVDGYACRRSDLGNELQILETIYAGMLPEYRIGNNECAKIMTGAPVPEGAECVFMLETALVLGENRVRCIEPDTAANIAFEGEDVNKGDLAVKIHTLIGSRHIPILAGAGMVSPLVFARPDISVFATGSELVEPEQTPLPQQIRNSNAYQMISQLADMGITGKYSGIIKDDRMLIEKKISEAFENSRVVLLSGGVSMGDLDFVPEVLKSMDFELLLTSSAIQPGKPILFAKRGAKYCFGLSGNPVSSFIQFELYAKPFIYSLMGHDYRAPLREATLGRELKRSKAERLKLVPAYLDQKNVVFPLEFHGSAHIDALSDANCLLEIPIGIFSLKKGDTIYARPL